MGYIDTPTHEEKGIQELTVLNSEAVKTLLCKHSEVIMGLNDLLTDIEMATNTTSPDQYLF